MKTFRRIFLGGIMPGHESEDHESWYINMGIVTKAFLDPYQMQNFAH